MFDKFQSLVEIWFGTSILSWNVDYDWKLAWFLEMLNNLNVLVVSTHVKQFNQTHVREKRVSMRCNSSRLLFLQMECQNILNVPILNYNTGVLLQNIGVEHPNYLFGIRESNSLPWAWSPLYINLDIGLSAILLVGATSKVLCHFMICCRANHELMVIGPI